MSKAEEWSKKIEAQGAVTAGQNSRMAGLPDEVRQRAADELREIERFIVTPEAEVMRDYCRQRREFIEICDGPPLVSGFFSKKYRLAKFCLGPDGFVLAASTEDFQPATPSEMVHYLEGEALRFLPRPDEMWDATRCENVVQQLAVRDRLVAEFERLLSYL